MVRRRIKLSILGFILVLVIMSASVYEYSLTQKQQQPMAVLRQSYAYDSRFNYELLASLNVDTLPKPSGEWSYKNLVVNYTYPNPYTFLNTYVSGPPCSPDVGKSRNIIQVFPCCHDIPPPTNCRNSLLILATNNQTDPYGLYAYEAPGSSYEFWYKPHLYVFLATYLDYLPPTNEQQQTADFLNRESQMIPQNQIYPFDPFNSRYEQLFSVDVQTLSETNGTWTSGNVSVTYRLARGGGVVGPENRPVLVLEINSGYLNCGTTYLCQSLLLVANNNLTSYHIENYSTTISFTRSFVYPLYTSDGNYIDWHLYLFLATYTA